MRPTRLVRIERGIKDQLAMSNNQKGMNGHMPVSDVSQHLHEGLRIDALCFRFRFTPLASRPVCLGREAEAHADHGGDCENLSNHVVVAAPSQATPRPPAQIGRASCRERV